MLQEYFIIFKYDMTVAASCNNNYDELLMRDLDKNRLISGYQVSIQQA